MVSISHLWQLQRHFGLSWLWNRAAYAARLRLGLVRRRIPIQSWKDQPLTGFLSDPALSDIGAYLDYRKGKAPRFFSLPEDCLQYRPLFNRWDKDEIPSAVAQAKALSKGSFLYFGNTPVQAGFPPDWHHNFFTGQQAPADIHWSRIGDFNYGDIKVIWEPNRFGFAYTLVRAYWRTGDETYPTLFWQLVKDWREKNPPQQGPNWKCGQEISFRVMAWCFGLYGFWEAQATTAENVSSLAQMIAVSGRRIEANIDYALNQQNNHGISEGLGLWTIGLLFPEFQDAPCWKERGREVLETQGRELIYDDGAFAQHSFNYQRLMIHDYVWAIRLGELNNNPLSRELRERVVRAGGFLYQLQDEKTGRLPNYGANDGALILPLNNCDYHDFRPVIQAVKFLERGSRCYPEGPWDEDLLWLFGPKVLESPVGFSERKDMASESGGYYTLRGNEGFVFTRCGSFKHRPSQADLLHVDLWWRGINIALDPGTFSYNAPDPWNNALAGTAYHNTVTVDGWDQMDRAGKFLWLPWVKGRTVRRERSVSGKLAYWEGGHDGYERLKPPVRYRRGILQMGDRGWLVLDRLTSSGLHNFRLHWLFADLPCEWEDNSGRLVLSTPEGYFYLQPGSSMTGALYSLVRADEGSPRGWAAPYYGIREPALSLALTVSQDNVLFWTLLTPFPCQLSFEGDRISVEGPDWQSEVLLNSDDKPLLVNSVFISGQTEEGLELN